MTKLTRPPPPLANVRVGPQLRELSSGLKSTRQRRFRCHETFAAKTRFGTKAAPAAQQFGLYAVAEYRLYCLDGVGKVASAEWIEAGDDEAAIGVAKETHDGHECELWQGKRLVVRLDLRWQA